MKVVLTIAGSDCSGGAGIQADLKTIAAHGMYGESVITALTAQNTMGVKDVLSISPEFLEKQLECVFTDIVPDAVKIGMVVEIGQMQVIKKCLEKYQAKHIVIDTVMMSSSGTQLMAPEAFSYYKEELLPIAEVYTPNIPEAEWLSGHTIQSNGDKAAVAEEFAAQYNGSIYLKGGHDQSCADDILICGEEMVWFHGKHIENYNTHGTGCTLSSAIACGLAVGKSVKESVRNAKEYVTGAILDGMELGKGNGPLNHMYQITQNR